MFLAANKNPPTCRLLLEMAFEAEGRVSLGEHPLVHRSVRRMAADAAFADRFVFENERAALGRVTLETGVVLAQQHGAAAFHALRKIRAAAFDRVALVRVVAIGAAHFAFEHRMMMR